MLNNLPSELISNVYIKFDEETKMLAKVSGALDVAIIIWIILS